MPACHVLPCVPVFLPSCPYILTLTILFFLPCLAACFCCCACACCYLLPSPLTLLPSDIINYPQFVVVLIHSLLLPACMLPSFYDSMLRTCVPVPNIITFSSYICAAFCFATLPYIACALASLCMLWFFIPQVQFWCASYSCLCGPNHY